MIIENIRRKFTRHADQLEYRENERRFSWVLQNGKSSNLPEQPGVYCLFSHDDQRIQKVGKADGVGGLAQRFRGYTAAKTIQKVEGDATDRRWRAAMTGGLRGQTLSIYYFVTPPLTLQVPFAQLKEALLEAHWARSFENWLSVQVRLELSSPAEGALQMLLSGQD